MIKLLLLFNELFLYLNAFHRILNFLEQTCTFLHFLTQLSSLSYVCFIRHGIFNFAAAFLFGCFLFFIYLFIYFFCRDFFILPWLFCFAVTFSFTVAFLFCHDFLVLPQFFYFAVNFSFFCGCFVLSWFLLCHGFLFCRGFLVLPWLFGFAVVPMGHRRAELTNFKICKLSSPFLYFISNLKFYI